MKEKLQLFCTKRLIQIYIKIDNNQEGRIEIEEIELKHDVEKRI